MVEVIEVVTEDHIEEEEDLSSNLEEEEVERLRVKQNETTVTD